MFFAVLSRIRQNNTNHKKHDTMKKAFFSLLLFCGLALMSTSCNDNNGSNVDPEVETGVMTIGDKHHDIAAAHAVNYGQRNAIVLASKTMNEAGNDGIAIIFEGDITPGTYTIGDKAGAAVPRVVGLHEVNMGELPFIMGSDTLYFGDTYFWIAGELSVTQNEDGTYTVILSQCVGANDDGAEIHLSLNFSGTLAPYTFDTDNKFLIGDREYPIGLAATAGIGAVGHLLDSLNPALSGRIQSMTFLSADHKNSYIINYLSSEDELVGTHSLDNLLPQFPYFGFATFPHVMATTSFDLLSFQPSTAYILTGGTLTIAKETEGQWRVTIENATLTNLEHPDWPSFNTTGALYYHGTMFEVGN